MNLVLIILILIATYIILTLLNYRHRIFLRFNWSQKKNMNKIINKTSKEIYYKYYPMDYKIRSLVYTSTVASYLDVDIIKRFYNDVNSFIEKNEDDLRIALAEYLLIFSILNKSNHECETLRVKANKFNDTLSYSFFETLLPNHTQHVYQLMNVQINYYLKNNEFSRARYILDFLLDEYVLDHFPNYIKKMVRFLNGYYYYLIGEQIKANEEFKPIYQSYLKDSSRGYAALFIIEKSFADELLSNGERDQAKNLYKLALSRIENKETTDLIDHISKEVKMLVD